MRYEEDLSEDWMMIASEEKEVNLLQEEVMAKAEDKPRGKPPTKEERVSMFGARGKEPRFIRERKEEHAAHPADKGPRGPWIIPYKGISPGSRLLPTQLEHVRARLASVLHLEEHVQHTVIRHPDPAERYTA